MSNRRTGIFLAALAALLAGLLTGRSIMFNLAYVLGFVIIGSFVWAYANINWVHLSRNTRTRRTQVGRPLEERFTVRNTGILPKLWLEVRDATDLPGHLPSYVLTNLGRKSSFTWRATTICQQRGRYQLGPVRIRTSDPFGLFPMERDWPVTNNVVVFPLTFELHQFALPIGMLPGGDALRRRTHYVTTNAAGVRDYAPGDSFSRIHWRSTARRDRLVVKEFELDPMADIWIVPDMAIFSHIAPVHPESASISLNTLPAWMRLEEFKLPASTEEYTVSIAASLAQYFLRRDRAVGLLAYGQSNEIVQPDRGERQLTRMLETLAVLRAEGQVALQDMLHAQIHLFPRGTTVIAVTSNPDEAWVIGARQLVRRGLRLVTVLVDSKTFGSYRSAEPLATLMQANGMFAYLVKNGDDIGAALSQKNVRSIHHALS